MNLIKSGWIIKVVHITVSPELLVEGVDGPCVIGWKLIEGPGTLFFDG